MWISVDISSRTTDNMHELMENSSRTRIDIVKNIQPIILFEALRVYVVNGSRVQFSTFTVSLEITRAKNDVELTGEVMIAYQQQSDRVLFLLHWRLTK